MTNADILIVAPEVVLAVYAMSALLFGVYTIKDALASAMTFVSAAVLVFVAVWIGLSGGSDATAFSGMFVDDRFSRFAKVIVLISAAVVLVMSESYMSKHGLLRFEYSLLVVLAVIGMMVMVSAGTPYAQ